MTWPVPTARKPTAPKLQWGNQRETHIHNGIDIPAREGAPVLATRAGTVTHASSSYAPGFSGYGAHVVVRAAAAAEWDLYAHLQRVQVAPGERIARGQQIGTVGRTGFTAEDPTKLIAGAHLHFERSPRAYPQRSDQPRLDPLPVLEAPMRSLADLSALFVALRNAAVGRDGKPRPGVSAATAAHVVDLAEQFRVWADTQAGVFPNQEWESWERRYVAAKAMLGAAGAPLEHIDPDRPNILERAVGAAGLAAGVVLALLLANTVSKGGRNG